MDLVSDCDDFTNIARRRARNADQFARKFIQEEEIRVNVSEWVDGFYSEGYKQASYTGSVIWEQTDGKLEAFVAAAGTGGTMAGVSKFLKGKKPSNQVLFD